MLKLEVNKENVRLQYTGDRNPITGIFRDLAVGARAVRDSVYDEYSKRDAEVFDKACEEVLVTLITGDDDAFEKKAKELRERAMEKEKETDKLKKEILDSVDAMEIPELKEAVREFMDYMESVLNGDEDGKTDNKQN